MPIMHLFFSGLSPTIRAETICPYNYLIQREVAMNILIKFLSMEPIENLVTAMHWRIDKIIFFGYEDYLAHRKKDTESFLKKYCRVGRVEFHTVSRTNLDNILKKIREQVIAEHEYGNSVFLDLTGGKGQVLAAFGMVEKELSLPMHLYWISEDRLIEYCHEKEKRLSSIVQPQSVELDLNRYIEMRGGVINYRMHKEIKEIDDEETEEIVNSIWSLFLKYEESWSAISGFLQRTLRTESLQITLDSHDVRDELKKSRSLPPVLLEQFLTDGEKRGIFLDLSLSRRDISFRFRSYTVRNILADAGSILELHVYQIFRAQTPNCKVGVHLDWDGIIHNRSGKDVVNEIDVLVLHGLIPTFISCKIGTADKNALYELSAVAARFGGRFSKMMLVAGKGMSETDLLRAAEMDIQVMNRDMTLLNPE